MRPRVGIPLIPEDPGIKTSDRVHRGRLRLPEHASEWVAHELGLLEIHLDLARNAFAEHFTARNTRAIYWLTIAALILAIVQPCDQRLHQRSRDRDVDGVAGRYVRVVSIVR